MVDIIPSSQMVIGNGAFSIVYRAKLKSVSDMDIMSKSINSKKENLISLRYKLILTER